MTWPGPAQAPGQGDEDRQIITWRILGGALAAVLLVFVGAYMGYVLRRLDGIDQRLESHFTDPHFHNALVAGVAGLSSLNDARHQQHTEELRRLEERIRVLERELPRR